MSYYQVVSIVVLHGESEKNINFEIWVRLTPSTPPPKFLIKTSFSGHFIKHVEEEASLFLADKNMKWLYNPPDSIQRHPDNSQTPPRTFQTPYRHPQSVHFLSITRPLGEKEATNKNE